MQHISAESLRIVNNLAACAAHLHIRPFNGPQVIPNCEPPVLIARSAVVLKAETEGLFVANDHDSVLLDHVQRTMFDCRGQDFKTVMGALHSNLSRWGVQDVTLVLQVAINGVFHLIVCGCNVDVLCFMIACCEANCQHK